MQNFSLAEFLVGLVASAIAFFLGRYVRKEKVTESLTRKNMLLDLLKKMKEEGVDGEKLAEIEREFETQDRIRTIEDRLTVESYDYGVDELQEAATQGEMNLAQARRMEMLERKLGAVVHELNSYLDDEGKAKLDAAQTAWERFLDRETEWVTRDWKEGTLAPLIIMGQRSRLIIERLAALENQLNEERAAYARGERD